jgi:hypothetical protein
MSKQNYKLGADRRKGGGTLIGRAMVPDNVWTPSQRALAVAIAAKKDEIHAAEKVRDRLLDDVAILMLEMVETGMSKTRVAKIYQMNAHSLADMLQRGDTARALRASGLDR